MARRWKQTSKLPWWRGYVKICVSSAVSRKAPSSRTCPCNHTVLVPKLSTMCLVPPSTAKPKSERFVWVSGEVTTSLWTTSPRPPKWKWDIMLAASIYLIYIILGVFFILFYCKYQSIQFFTQNLRQLSHLWSPTEKEMKPVDMIPYRGKRHLSFTQL